MFKVQKQRYTYSFNFEVLERLLQNNRDVIDKQTSDVIEAIDC